MSEYKPHIFVLDDDKDFLELVSEHLISEGYEVTAQADPDVAIAQIKEGEFNLIILDVMMPGIDGYVVCEKLKEDDETFDIPVLFLTAKTEAGDMLRGFFSGAHDYLCKPIERDALFDKVHVLLGQ